jgi:hypothetical protein
MQRQLAQLRLDWIAPVIFSMVLEAHAESPSGHRLVVKG